MSLKGHIRYVHSNVCVDAFGRMCEELTAPHVKNFNNQLLYMYNRFKSKYNVWRVVAAWYKQQNVGSNPGHDTNLCPWAMHFNHNYCFVKSWDVMYSAISSWGIGDTHACGMWSHRKYVAMGHYLWQPAPWNDVRRILIKKKIRDVKFASGIKTFIFLFIFYLFFHTPMCVSTVYSVLSRVLWKNITGMLLGWDSNPRPLQF